MIVIGGLILIPKGLSLLKINILTDDILKWYNSDLLKYSKLLLTVGIIFLLISCITNNIFNKFMSFITSYINSHEKQEREISEKNDLLMKEKQEKTNESLSMTIDELASLTKIQEVAQEQGLSYNNNNIRTITKDN
mgnify:CR=1 FL=1